MNYSNLSEVYSNLEKTTKKLEKTKILSEFLVKVPEKELKEIIYLLQGNVFPRWDERKLGVSSRLAIKAISNSTGINPDKIEKEWVKIGDLGEVLEKLSNNSRQQTLLKKTLTVPKVYENLLKIAQLEGKGTVSKKLNLIIELLGPSSSEESKYIIRTVIGDLRIGVAEGLLRDSIAWAYLPRVKKINDYNVKGKTLKIKSIRELKESDLKKYKIIETSDEKLSREIYNYLIKKVQHSYDLVNDFGEVAISYKNFEYNKLHMKPLTPVNPMLAVKAESPEDALKAVGSPAQIENKYDGFRCISGNTPIYTLNNGYLSVKDIKIGYKVLTHRGNFRKVININKRKLDKRERVFEIQSYFGDNFRISEGHKILVKKNNVIKWTPIEKISNKDLLIFSRPKLREKSILKKELILGDDSGYHKKIVVDNFFFRFLGFWIGDGFTNNYHNTERVGLLFNKIKESKLCEYYSSNLIAKFGIKNTTKSYQGNMINLYFRDKPLRIWLSTHFRREWRGKMLPNWFLGINKEQFEFFIKGYLEADGHMDSKGRANIITKERDIAMTVQLLGLKFGKLYGVKKFRVSKGTYYSIIIPKSSKYFKLDRNNYYVKINKLKELNIRDSRMSLYNLHVEKDESYCTSLVSLHNCQIHKGDNNYAIFTRRLENVTKQFPELIPIINKHIKAKSCILDSEVVGYDPKTNKTLPFQHISQRIKRKYELAKIAHQVPVVIHVFDILFYNNKPVIDLSQKERRQLLKKIIKEEPRKIILTESLTTDNPKEISKFYNQALKLGHEGLMIKSLNSPYVPGRRVGGWVKLKPEKESLDLVIVSAEWGTGKRAKTLSSFNIACRDKNKFLEIGKVSTGIAEKNNDLTYSTLTKELKPLITKTKGKKVIVKPKIVLEVTYDEIQKSTNYSSGWALRFPRVKIQRGDRSANDIETLDSIKTLYNKQKKAKT